MSTQSANNVTKYGTPADPNNQGKPMNPDKRPDAPEWKTDFDRAWYVYAIWIAAKKEGVSLNKYLENNPDLFEYHDEESFNLDKWDSKKTSLTQEELTKLDFQREILWQLI